MKGVMVEGWVQLHGVLIPVLKDLRATPGLSPAGSVMGWHMSPLATLTPVAHLDCEPFRILTFFLNKDCLPLSYSKPWACGPRERDWVRRHRTYLLGSRCRLA